MKRTVWLWQLWGFGIVSLLGTLLHFLYEWLGEPVWVAPFSGVNESTWEHMKLLFWPMLAYTVFEGFFFRDRDDFWCIKLRGILLGLALIPLIFYIYNGVIGKSPDWANIAIFFISAAIAYVYEIFLFYKTARIHCTAKTAICILTLISALFVIFTFTAPKINIFKDPITNLYGI